MPLTHDIGVRIPYPLPKKAIGNGRFFCSGPEATAGPAGREGRLAPGKPGQPPPPGGKTARRQVELRSEGGRGSRPNGRRGSDPRRGEAPTKKRDSPNGRSNGRDSAQRRKRLLATRGAARPAKKGQRPHAQRYGTAPRDAHTAQPPDAGDLRRSSFLSPAPDTRPDAPPAKPRQDTDTRPEAPPAKTEQDPARHRPTPNTAAPRHAPIRPKISRR